MTRQNFYKTRKKRQIQALDERLIKRLVLDERAFQPRLGGRKLLKLLSPKLNDCGIGIGRDRFFNILNIGREATVFTSNDQQLSQFACIFK
jgi:hypothetical protein